jgi:transcriptional regulator with XRE-family HTH domain
MAEPPKALGGIIKAVRRAHGMSGMQFALKIGVSLDTLRSWEIGRSRPDAENLLKLADLAPPTLTWDLLREIRVTPARVRSWLARQVDSTRQRRKRQPSGSPPHGN